MISTQVQSIATKTKKIQIQKKLQLEFYSWHYVMIYVGKIISIIQKGMLHLFRFTCTIL